MDPNATLALIARHLSDGAISEARVACDDLTDWLDRGGFEPRWLDYPDAADFFASL